MGEQDIDVIVIGGGTAGENVVDYAQQRGLSAVIVEKQLVGGECSYWGCMPSKALLRPTEALAAVRRVRAAAAAVTGEVDVEGVLRLRDAFASRWDDSGQVKWLESVDVPLVRGVGRITGEREVTVTDGDGKSVLTARRAVVIATGTRAAIPPIEGLDDVRAWDNRDATTAQQIPNRLLVLGGGTVGVEMAQAFKRLGSAEVSILEVEDRLLGDEEPFAGIELAEALADDGITIETGIKTVRVERAGADGPVTAHLADGRALVADEILVATGRQAATDNIGLDAVGLEPGEFVTVDDHLRVAGVDGDWLYAVGDVNGRALLTHQGKYQARLLGDHLAGVTVDPAWADHDALPRIVFTDPNVAAVGLTQAQAQGRGIEVRTVQHDLGRVAGGKLVGKGFGGTAQLVIDQDRRVIVGATFVAPGAAEHLHAATIAIVGQVPIDRLWHAVPGFPTVSEVWLRLLEADRRLELN